MAERKNPKLNAQHQAILKRMMQLPENKICADCKGPYPRWASTNLGIFICMTCSGIHRKLGTHLSQVRSITLDTWTPAQISHFQKLGNAKAEKYFEACLPADPADFRRPHASDSMRMESFIRDKYEHRRFITVENGGLGGATPSFATRSNLLSSSSSLSTNNNTLGSTRPKQRHHQQQQFHHNDRSVMSTHPYDDDGRSRRPAVSNSYAARFSNNTNNSNNNSQHQLQSRTAITTSTTSTLVSNSNVRNPVVRATTLKELVNMGFSTDISLRAVEASGGDLQRAVDWVLQNSTQTNPSATSTSATNTKHNHVASKPTVVPDLLDFGDPTPIPPTTSTTTTTAKTNSSATTITPSSSTKKPSHVADFADFGEFETALPSTTSKQTASTPPAKPTSSSLSSSLADLYKRPLPKPASATVKNPNVTSSATITTTTTTTATTATASSFTSNRNVNSRLSQPVNPSTTSAQQFKFAPLSPTQKPLDGSKVGLARIDLTPDLSFKNKPKSVQSMNQKPGMTQTSNGISHPHPQQQQPVPPPPPPPMQDEPIVATDDGPPPPSPPNPSPNTSSVNVISEPAAHKKTDADVDAEQQTDTTINTKETEKKDEDPFAALSMMALSSATGGSKKKNTVTIAMKSESNIGKNPNNNSDIGSKSNVTPTTKPSSAGGIASFDDLLG